MSGCQRLWPVCGSAASGSERSIRISCVAMVRTIGFSAQASGGGEHAWIFSCGVDVRW